MVCFVERIGDVDADLQHLLEWDRPLGVDQPVHQRLAVEILHDEVVDLFVTADVVDSANVRMRQRGNRPRLALESRAAVGIGREGFRQDLDRDGAIQPRVPGFVDLAHPACPAGGEDFVRTESSAGGESQTLAVDYTGGAGSADGITPE